MVLDYIEGETLAKSLFTNKGSIFSDAALKAKFAGQSSRSISP